MRPLGQPRWAAHPKATLAMHHIDLALQLCRVVSYRRAAS
jgi:hypothetical protein